MITNTHMVFYSENSEADRAFFRDILKFRSGDAGHGWLIFAFPLAEAGVHPAEGTPKQSGNSLGSEVYLTCDDLEAQVKELEAKSVRGAPVEGASWGTKTTLRLPSGGTLGLYQPRHPTAIDMK
jgi:hypothetical protein